MSKRKEAPSMEKTFTDLFTMTDSRSEEAGKFFTLTTSATHRKDVKMTRTYAKTPQFEVEYNGKIKILTMGLCQKESRAEWPFVLARFIGLKITPPAEIYLEGWYTVTENGELTDEARRRIQADVKTVFLHHTNLHVEGEHKSDD